MLLTFVLRNIRKRLSLNLIKVAGLALGLTGILMIILFLKNELSYDSFHSKANRIYRFTTTDPSFLSNSHFARVYNSEDIPGFAASFPEIESFVRLAPIRGGFMLYNEKYYTIDEAFQCDSTFFRIFDARLLTGDSQKVLEDPGSMVISQSFARRVFGSADPVGEVISIPPGQYYGEKTDFTIRGVMEDFPQNSHFHPDLVTTPAKGSVNWWAFVYLLLTENGDPQKIITGYPGYLSTIAKRPIEDIETKAHLQKITDIHLKSDKLREIESNSNITSIYVLGIAAFILLLISLTNLASLNLSMSFFNHKFFVVNRVLGCPKRMNLNYFLVESLLITGLAILLALIIVVPANGLVYGKTGYNLLQGNTLTVISIITVFSFMALLAGVQPELKNRFDKQVPGKNFQNGIAFNRGIIVVQFAFAIVLIVAVLVISRQTGYALKESMGAQNSNLICFESVHTEVQKKFELFKAELLRHNTIESVSAMMEPPGGEANDMFAFELEGFTMSDEKQIEQIGVFPCDFSFATIFKLEFLAGENFTENNNDADGSGEYIINEAALNYLNYNSAKDIIGKSFRLKFDSPGIVLPRGRIIGVVNDFHLSSIKKKVGPLVMFKRDSLWLINFVVAYKPGMHNAAVKDIQTVWEQLFPAHPFVYDHVDSMYREVYSTELLQARLLTIFTFISLFICSIGLLGLSLLAAQQRVKEIGIRKVNGARIFELLFMLNKDIMKWIVTAFVIAIPIAYYLMFKWLQNFVYHIRLHWWIFALAGIMALVIALLTVSWQSWQAAKRNPVEALRYE